MTQTPDNRDHERARKPGDEHSGKRPDDQSQNANMAMIGLQVAIGVGLGLVVGQWLDRRYGWRPWGSTIGAMLGLAGGLYLLIKEAIRVNKD